MAPRSPCQPDQRGQSCAEVQPGVQLSLAVLSAMGVRRVSVGSALSRAALGASLRAVREMLEYGTFAFAGEAVSYREINAMFKT